MSSFAQTYAQPGLPLAGLNAEPSREAPGLNRIGVDEKLDTQVPLNLIFQNHLGEEVQLNQIIKGDKPVLFTFAYHSCPVLCNLVLDAMVKSIDKVKWTVGAEYTLVNISIDPKDTFQKAAQKRAQLISKYGRAKENPSANPQLDWHFLVGEQDNIDAITAALGFRYFYNTAQEQYAHPAVIMFLTPEGKIARYLYGIEYDPRNVELALLEASKGKSISTVERVLLYCYQYDPESSSYALVATRIMKIGGGLTVTALGIFIFAMWRRESYRRSQSVVSVANHESRTRSHRIKS